MKEDKHYILFQQYIDDYMAEKRDDGFVHYKDINVVMGPHYTMLVEPIKPAVEMDAKTVDDIAKDLRRADNFFWWLDGNFDIVLSEKKRRENAK